MEEYNSYTRPIYLDYAATTPIDNIVLEKMLPYMRGEISSKFGNPASSTHIYGWEAKSVVEKSRRLIAKLLNTHSKEIIFTSGATESNNLAIIGIAEAYQARGKHIITSMTEHKAVLDTCKYLESNRGYDVTYLQPQKDGLINLDDIKNNIRKDTVLISIMHVNNETGIIQDVASIGDLAREYNIFFHVDAAQSAGKLDLDLDKLKIDLLSISGHKIYGPKGIGVLYIRKNPKVNLQAQMHGGGHEYGFRSGTLATHQIVGLAQALKLSYELMSEESNRLKLLESKLIHKLNKLGGIVINGNIEHKKPGYLNISVEGIHGESLIASLNKIAVSSGSACNSAVSGISHVLNAMQVPKELAQTALRISIGRFTTEEDIDLAIEHLEHVITKLRNISPVWHKKLEDNMNYKIESA